MNFCSACGDAVPTNAKFCPECGATVTAVGTEEAGDVGAPDHRVFTKGFVTVLATFAVFGLAGAGIAYGLTRGGGYSGSYEACIADSNTKYEECEGLKHEFVAPESDRTVATQPPQAASDPACYDDASCAAAEAGDVGSAGTTCLEWKTSYSQQYVAGTPALGGSSWDGSRWVQNSPGTPGHWEQFPTGQTCVREG